MGAVTALLYAQRDPFISVVCADSPFASLPELMQELGTSNAIPAGVPSWLVSAAMALVRMRVIALADFDVEDVVPETYMQSCHIPILFLHGLQDTLISMRHAQRLLRAHGGKKELLQVPGDHNSPRGFDAVQYAASFMCRQLGSSWVRSKFPDLEVSPVSTCPDVLVSSLPTPCRRSTASLRKPVQMEQMREITLDDSFADPLPRIAYEHSFMDSELGHEESPLSRSEVCKATSSGSRSSSPIRLGLHARCVSHSCVSVDDVELGLPNRPSRRVSFGDSPLPKQPRSNARPVDGPIPMQARTQSRPHHSSAPSEAESNDGEQVHEPMSDALDRIVAGVVELEEAADLLRELEESDMHEFTASEPQSDSPEPTAPAMSSSKAPRLPGSSCGHHGVSLPIWRKSLMRRCVAV